MYAFICLGFFLNLFLVLKMLNFLMQLLVAFIMVPFINKTNALFRYNYRFEVKKFHVISDEDSDSESEGFEYNPDLTSSEESETFDEKVSSKCKNCPAEECSKECATCSIEDCDNDCTNCTGCENNLNKEEESTLTQRKVFLDESLD